MLCGSFSIHGVTLLFGVLLSISIIKALNCRMAIDFDYSHSTTVLSNNLISYELLTFDTLK
jgi:hypothetical protein